MSAIICDCCGKETTKNHRVIVTSTLAGVVMCHNCEGSIPVPIPHLKETCEKFQENGIGCVDCFCDKSCQDLACPVCGGNSSSAIEGQIRWLSEISNDK